MTYHFDGLKEWAIAKRKHYEQKRKDRKLENPNDVSLNSLGAKINAFQQVIDKCKKEEKEFCCYHVTTKDRLESILENGLIPNSKPNWFESETPYIMLSLYPYWSLYDNPVLIEIKDPVIRWEYFDDPEGLRWPYPIKPEYFRAVIEFKVIKEVNDG